MKNQFKPIPDGRQSGPARKSRADMWQMFADEWINLEFELQLGSIIQNGSVVQNSSMARQWFKVLQWLNDFSTGSGVQPVQWFKGKLTSKQHSKSSVIGRSYSNVIWITRWKSAE